MNKLSSTLVALAMFTSGTASAGLVYLDCTIEEFKFKVTLDEDSQTVSHVVVHSGLSRGGLRGVFSPETVSYVVSRGELHEMQFEISRIDLTYTRYIPSIKAKNVGKCELRKAPENRKF
jgi:hypothetical protein